MEGEGDEIKILIFLNFFSLDDSDDSLPEDNYDAALDNHTANNHVDVRPQFSEDIENMMSGKNKSRQVWTWFYYFYIGT